MNEHKVAYVNFFRFKICFPVTWRTLAFVGCYTHARATQRQSGCGGRACLGAGVAMGV